MTPIVLLALLAQFPPESAPVQPTIPVPFVFTVINVPPAALDLPAAPHGEPIKWAALVPGNILSSDAEVQAFCQQAQSALDLAYSHDPGNATRFQLVACQWLPDYVAPNNTTTELAALHNSVAGLSGPSGTINGITPQWRSTLRVDVPVLFDRAPGSCGQSFIGAGVYGKDWAQSIVNVDCAVSNFSLAHELGHLLSLYHDSENDGGTVRTFPFANGKCDPTHHIKSPMVYPSPCAEPRVPYWSDPDREQTINGHTFVFGDSTHNESAALRYSMPRVANFYEPFSHPPPISVTWRAAPAPPIPSAHPAPSGTTWTQSPTSTAPSGVSWSPQ